MDLQQRAINYLKNEMTDVERQQFEEELARSEALRTELEKGREVLDLLEVANEESNVRRCNTIIQEAIKYGASDIHILPGPAGAEHDETRTTLVLYRIDGQIHDMMKIGGESHPAIIDRLKKMAECPLTERSLPQDGRIHVRYEGKEYQLLVNFMPTINGERVTARLFDKQKILIGLDNLGLLPAQIEALERLTERPYGLILTAGQVNTGKTTLLYSLLNGIQSRAPRRKNILTVESPVEYRLPGLSQTMVNRKAGLTFAAALRGFIRCDPDVIYIAELRDLETAELATELALVRALVLTQLHVSSALLIPQRLRDMGVVPFLIAQTLAGTIGQRLVRKVCPECVTEYAPAPEALEKLALSREDGAFRRGAGCGACYGTGFKGRIGLVEVWEIDEAARKLIAECAPVEALWEASFGRTGGSLWDDARAKVRLGLTTVEEAAWALFDYPVPAQG